MQRQLRRLVPAVIALFALTGTGVASADTVTCGSVSIDDGAGGVWTPNALGELNSSITTSPLSAKIDAYDNFGKLFVNGTGYDATGQNCTRLIASSSARGTTVTYPAVSIAGLNVHRTVTIIKYAAGATYNHIAVVNNVLVNPSGSPISVSVAVGEDGPTTNQDDLGSDSGTQVLASSSGDMTATTSDQWAVTGDAPAGSGLNDPLILHAWGGFFPGAVRPDVVGVSGTDPDNWRTRWTSVSVPAGKTVTLSTLEGNVVASDNTVSSTLSAMQQSISSSVSPNTFFAGEPLTVAEIAASKNVQPPTPSLNAGAPDHAAVGESFQLGLGFSTTNFPIPITQCGATTGSLTYDGTVVLSSSGSTTTATGVAGTHPWSATASNLCATATTSGSTIVDGNHTTCVRGFDAGEGNALLDGTGAGYDPGGDGSLVDGGSRTPITTGDAYDNLGVLTVGGTSYGVSSPVCTLEASGRLIRYPDDSIGGLQVSRSTWVPSGGAGARMALILRNAGGSAVTVPVQYGSSNGLGSDDGTVVTATGNGTTSVTPAARWMVTDDTDGTDDPALAHVWDGAGGSDAADFVRLTDPGTPSDKDDYEVGYDNVTVQPGQSAVLILWEAQRFRNPRAVGEDADAQTAATTLAGLSGDGLYGGMSAAEIASTRNWAHPDPTGTISGPASGVIGAPQAFSISGLGAGASACTASVAWTVDGAAAGGAGSISPTFATAGVHTVAATITNDCGGAAVKRSATFTASAPTPPPPGATAAKITKLTLVGTCLKAPKSTTLKVRASVSGATKVTVKVAKVIGTAKRCVKPTSAAGKALLKKKLAPSALSKSVTVRGGKISFSVKVKAVRRGTAKLKGKTLTLPKGAYVVTVTSGKTKVTGLVVVY